jgi:DUF4097 and DUF4098 domain-containing protein YvlB
MPTARIRLLGLLSCVVLTGLGCTIDLAAEPFTEREEKTFAVSGKADVRLVTFDGSIEIESWTRSDVAVTIERRAVDAETARQLRVRAEQDGNRVTVEVVKPEHRQDWFANVSPSVSLKVFLPQASDVQARTGDGSIRARDVSGRISLNTGDGSIHGAKLSGEVTAHTGDGSVTLDDVSGRVNLHTGDGGVSVVGALAALKAHTGDGSIAVRATGDSATAEDWDLTTGDGGMTLELPSNFNAEVDARTGDGGISVEGFDVTQTGYHSERDELRGRFGTGGRTLRLRTGDGSIRIRRSS